MIGFKSRDGAWYVARVDEWWYVFNDGDGWRGWKTRNELVGGVPKYMTCKAEVIRFTWSDLHV